MMIETSLVLMQLYWNMTILYFLLFLLVLLVPDWCMYNL